MESEIGNLAEGKLADIIIFDPISSSMVRTAERDPCPAFIGLRCGSGYYGRNCAQSEWEIADGQDR
jgi:hypothetical protein